MTSSSSFCHAASSALCKERVEELARKYACERDLLSGLRDNVTKIPIIAIPNRQPGGPCRNTLVDVAEVEPAVQFLPGAPTQ